MHLSADSAMLAPYKFLLRLKSLDRIRTLDSSRTFNFSVIFSSSLETRQVIQGDFLSFLKKNGKASVVF